MNNSEAIEYLVNQCSSISDQILEMQNRIQLIKLDNPANHNSMIQIKDMLSNISDRFETIQGKFLDIGE